eukprot:CAMPEP_0183302332 /NCGR_PEP_ID=MMETSP0160_2-20130417/8155_1 /TAXON_ID=2839 ORGANISM="Odontella Sinensis, Strain Grunow 1884" /NCGR_SAMPLE_ID=MMETSP0160_2 /ASSEMBLY_ACC=CAM_ASM_000250 /LENGTH=65 /DNA_ID=CAMNT_0025465089 /DNA_START=165 /DNA_END=362 /DNA_ORIENTATION=+
MRHRDDKGLLAPSGEIQISNRRVRLVVAVAALKVDALTQVTLEALAFANASGEPGESILDWADDH